MSRSDCSASACLPSHFSGYGDRRLGAAFFAGAFSVAAFSVAGLSVAAFLVAAFLALFAAVADALVLVAFVRFVAFELAALLLLEDFFAVGFTVLLSGRDRVGVVRVRLLECVVLRAAAADRAVAFLPLADFAALLPLAAFVDRAAPRVLEVDFFAFFAVERAGLRDVTRPDARFCFGFAETAFGDRGIAVLPAGVTKPWRPLGGGRSKGAGF